RQGYIRHSRNWPACIDVAGAGRRLIQIAPADQSRSLGTHVTHTGQHVGAKLPLQSEVPLLRVGVAEIVIQAVDRWERLESGAGRKGVRKSEKPVCAGYEEAQLEKRRVEILPGIRDQRVGIVKHA